MKTIFLVDDSATILLSISGVLSKAGYAVEKAPSALDALKTFQAGIKVDLLITDIVMPRMRGTALARQLSILCPSARVLFVSGQIDDEIVQHGQLLPGLSFLPKPFSARDLLRKVRQVLDG